MNLYLDAGNSRLKWLLDGDKKAQVATSIETLVDQWKAIKPAQKPARVIGSSVLGEAIETKLASAVNALFKTDIEWQVSSAKACGVVNAYAQPDHLGVDRWAALIAGRALFPDSACIVVDAGTATTVDLLDKSGQHLGGVIMPGIELMLKALGTTAQLSPDFSDRLGQVKALAQSTQDAIASGVYFSMLGGVRAVIEQQVAQINAKINAVPIIITGGSADMLQLTPMQVHHQPNLVLDGLRLMAGSKQ